VETAGAAALFSMSIRFTMDGSEALERRLEDLCMQAREGVLKIIPSSSLDAFVLGGGYGRGEGGVLSTRQGDQPYNDLEFYVLLRGNGLFSQRRYGRAIHELAERLSRAAEIEVEFKLLPTRKLQHSTVTMFYYDLVTGHRLVAGTDAWLASSQHHRAAHRIPLYEATRLLMNRCSGLLFADERLARAEFAAEDADFVGRNLAKAKLALGDVILTMRGQYHWSCRERQKRFKKLAAEDSLLRSVSLLHEQGVEFKLHPIRTARSSEELRSEAGFVKEIARDLWLQLESRRLGRKFTSIPSYSTDPEPKCPETKPLKNRLINARAFGLRALLDSRYPRERLLRTLPLLLWGAEPLDFLTFLRDQLKTDADDFTSLVRAYEAIWKHFN
jgi:hypothetical protein